MPASPAPRPPILARGSWAEAQRITAILRRETVGLRSRNRAYRELLEAESVDSDADGIRDVYEVEAPAPPSPRDPSGARRGAAIRAPRGDGPVGP